MQQKPMLHHLLLLSFFCLCTITTTQAQSKYPYFSAGVHTWYDLSAGGGDAFFFKGIQTVYHINRRHGMELALAHTSERLQILGTINDPLGMPLLPFSNSVRIHYSGASLLYRRSFGQLHVSGGPFFDSFLGWRQIDRNPGTQVTDVNRSPNTITSLLLKTAYTLPSRYRWHAEPELRLRISGVDAFIGVGVAIRFDAPPRSAK